MLDKYVEIVNENINEEKLKLIKEDEEKYEEKIDEYDKKLSECYEFIGKELREKD